jgi:hypothetical protein
MLGCLLVLEILFILNLHRTLERVSPQNRTMAPGLVWLQLVPLFGFFWFFYVVVKVRDSVRAEYQARGWPVGGDFGLNIGIATGVLRLIASGASLASSDRFVAMMLVLSLGSLVCWIIYWARTAGFKNRLGPPQWAAYGPFPAGSPYGPPPYDTGFDLVEPGGGTLLCPVCATTVREHDRFCCVCGSRLPWGEQ